MQDKTTMNIETHPSGVTIVRFAGDLDSLGTHTVQKSFESALTTRGLRVVVDLQQVEFISSAGMAMLLVRGKTLRQGGGRLAIAGANHRVSEVLSLAGFHELFEVYPTIDAAVQATVG